MKEPLEKGERAHANTWWGIPLLTKPRSEDTYFWYGPAGRPAKRERAPLRAHAEKYLRIFDLAMTLFNVFDILDAL